MTIAELNRRMQAVDIYKLGQASVMEHEDELIKLNQDQLLQGEKADETQVGTYKWNSYANQKYIQNPRAGFGNVDLRKTGAFFNWFYVTLKGRNQFTLSSSDDKTSGLVSKYDANIFGITPPNSRIAGEQYVQPTLIQKIKDLLFK